MPYLDTRYQELPRNTLAFWSKISYGSFEGFLGVCPKTLALRMVSIQERVIVVRMRYINEIKTFS